jgi:indole-3-glycerol phosphate synthase
VGKRREIAPKLRTISETELARLDASRPRPPSFAAALRRADGALAVISEIKRRSPSAGAIKADASSLEQAQRYQSAGADAISVLTDEKYFGGTLDGSSRRDRMTSPAARPAFPASERTSWCTRSRCTKRVRRAPVQFSSSCARSRMRKSRPCPARRAPPDSTRWFEIHTEAELERAVDHGATIIGVNNRDLAVFRTDLGLSERLIPLFPRAVTAVSESGISTGADATRVRAAGAHAVLVGEALMRALDPAKLMADLRRF